jgi:DNA repair protein RadC
VTVAQDDRHRFRIAELPRALRPRERLRRTGPRGLGHAELLSVVLGTGLRGRSALAVSEAILRRYGLRRLPELGLEEWRSNTGVGPAQACRLAATFELGRRVFPPVAEAGPRISCPAEVFAQVPELRRARKERLAGLYLDAQNTLIAKETLSVGSLNTTRTHPREILYPAIRHSAVSFVLVHNHPSGNLQPSRDDVEFTRTVRQAAELMGFELYDHLVVGAGGFASLKERGLL